MLIGHSTQIYHIENDMYTFIRVSLYFITLNPNQTGGGGCDPPLDVSRDNFVEIFPRTALS